MTARGDRHDGLGLDVMRIRLDQAQRGRSIATVLEFVILDQLLIVNLFFSFAAMRDSHPSRQYQQDLHVDAFVDLLSRLDLLSPKGVPAKWKRTSL